MKYYQNPWIFLRKISHPFRNYSQIPIIVLLTKSLKKFSVRINLKYYIFFFQKNLLYVVTRSKKWRHFLPVYGGEWHRVHLCTHLYHHGVHSEEDRSTQRNATGPSSLEKCRTLRSSRLSGWNPYPCVTSSSGCKKHGRWRGGIIEIKQKIRIFVYSEWRTMFGHR